VEEVVEVARMNFNTAFERLIGHEGGYINHSQDPGGETKYGISKRQYPGLHIAELTLDDAKAIYKRDYWDKVDGDSLPYPIAFEVFDAAVNHGVSRAQDFMEAALDGADPQTISPDLFIRRFNGHRLQFFTDLRTWGTFGRGWARRVANNLRA
jgi:lysozyme family protein